MNRRPVRYATAVPIIIAGTIVAIVLKVLEVWPRPHPWACRGCHRSGAQVLAAGERVVGLLCSECSRSAA